MRTYETKDKKYCNYPEEDQMESLEIDERVCAKCAALESEVAEIITWRDQDVCSYCINREPDYWRMRAFKAEKILDAYQNNRCLAPHKGELTKECRHDQFCEVCQRIRDALGI